MADPNTPQANRNQPADEGKPDGPGERGSATAVLEDLETLRARAQERDQFLDLLKRTQADFENYQKRMRREREEEWRYRHRDFAQELLPALDNLDRATEAAKKAGETGPLVQGVGMVRSQLLDLLRRHGVTPMDALGKPFDPNRHQAIMQQPSAEHPPNTVVNVAEQGFMIHDRVLRPARVVVSVPGDRK